MPSMIAPRRSAAREAAILDVAWQVFLKDGYVGASTAEICERVGGSKATLYSYFPSKEALFLAAVQHLGDRLFTELVRQPPQWDELREGLSQFGYRLIDIVLSDTYLALQRLVIAECGRFPVLSKANYDDRRDVMVGPLSIRLSEEMNAGRLVRADPMETAEMFWNLCTASVYRRALVVQRARFSREDIDHQVKRAVKTFLAAYGTVFDAPTNNRKRRVL